MFEHKNLSRMSHKGIFNVIPNKHINLCLSNAKLGATG